ncbi:hypothetical protein GCM10010425_38540 [Streptomyces spororaveus]|uniref:Small secreted domain DUF320 n=1 Tax=Streptomyces spororaveus TaxID=284039 RepID=A0ABQ3TPQ6_9ACTN|nr:hypothetical protein Sspor_79450 [Streptomyces spororaveus]
MNNTSRALTALCLGTAALLGVLAAPASAAPTGLLDQTALAPVGRDICKTLHGLPIAGRVGDNVCYVVDDLPAVGGVLTPIIGVAPR